MYGSDGRLFAGGAASVSGIPDHGETGKGEKTACVQTAPVEGMVTAALQNRAGTLASSAPSQQRCSRAGRSGAPVQPEKEFETAAGRDRPGISLQAGTLSGRQVIEIRESDLEKISKELVETDLFDPARSGMRGATVHGHSLRLDENGLMFDGLQRYVFDEETGHVIYIKDQVGRLLDESVDVGEPLPEDYLNEITTIYREDNIGLRSDKELIEVIENIHTSRTEGGFGLNVLKDDLKKRLGDE